MNYKKQLVKFNINTISILSVILFVVPAAIALLINLLWLKRPLLITDKVYWDILIIIGIMAVGLVAHEGIHALSAMVFGKCAKSDLSFGANFKQLILYCHVKKPLTASQYMAMLLPPVIITGIIPLIISAFCGNVFLIVVFSMLVSGGAGDFIMFFSLTKRDKKQLILDHPTAPAYYLVYPENETPDDFVESTEEQEKELSDEMNNTKGSSGGKSKGLKILAILVFLAATTLVVFLIALFMKLF